MTVNIWFIWNQHSDQSTALVLQRSWVQIPHRTEFFPGLIFTTAQVVFITAKIALIFYITDTLSCALCATTLFLSQLTLSVIYYWTTDAPQLGFYLFNRKQNSFGCYIVHEQKEISSKTREIHRVQPKL